MEPKIVLINPFIGPSPLLIPLGLFSIYSSLKEKNIHPVETDISTPMLAAKAYEQQLRDQFKLNPGDFPTFDFILLGVGEDGHTASLFPRHKEATELERLAVAVTGPDIKIPRVSLSLATINHARHIFVLATGENKAEILRKIFIGKEVLPISLIHPPEGTLVYLLDKDAAAGLPKDDFSHFEDAIVMNL